MGERRSPIRVGLRETHQGRAVRCLSLVVIALATGLGLTMPGARAAHGDVYVGFVPSAITVAPGDTFTAYVAILQPDAEFNAFDASVRFDPAWVTFEPTSPTSDQRGPVMTSACATAFHRFEPAPDSLKITLGLLCGNTFVTGPGTIYRVRFRAGMAHGTTTLSLGPFTELYRAGLFVRPLHKQDMTVTIGGPTGVGGDDGLGGRLELGPPAPNPCRGRDTVLLEFNLPGPDVVSFDVLDAQGRRVAGRNAEWYEAGRHRVPWSPPALVNGSYFVRLRTLASGRVVRRWAVLR